MLLSGAEGRSYLTPLNLMKTPFMLGQLLLNVIASYCGVLFFFWLIFVQFGKDGYGCYSSEVLSPILLSPFAGPVLALAWAPVAMIEAVEKGWFGFVRQSDLSGGVWILFPCFRFERGVIRHSILGCQLAVIAIPIMLLIVIFGIAKEFEDKHGVVHPCYLTNWQQVLSCVTYIALLPFYVVPIGLLGFAREKNLERVFLILSDKSLIQKGIYAPLC